MKEISIAVGMICALIASAVLFAFALIRYTELPEVWLSHETGACVRVLVDGTDVGCEHLKTLNKYETVWVK